MKNSSHNNGFVSFVNSVINHTGNTFKTELRVLSLRAGIVFGFLRINKTLERTSLVNRLISILL